MTLKKLPSIPDDSLNFPEWKHFPFEGTLISHRPTVTNRQRVRFYRANVARVHPFFCFGRRVLLCVRACVCALGGGGRLFNISPHR